MAETDLDENNIPTEIKQAAKFATQNLLPKKSHHLYNNEYKIFKQWQRKKNCEIVNEDVLLAYISELVSLIKNPSAAKYFLIRKLKTIVCNTCVIALFRFVKLLSTLGRFFWTLVFFLNSRKRSIRKLTRVQKNRPRVANNFTHLKSAILHTYYINSY